jgi:hypothetical protein
VLGGLQALVRADVAGAVRIERRVARLVEALEARALALGAERARRELDEALVLLDDLDRRQPPTGLIDDDAAVRSIQLARQLPHGQAGPDPEPDPRRLVMSEKGNSGSRVRG